MFCVSLSATQAGQSRTVKLLNAVRGPDYGDQLEYLRTTIRRLPLKIDLEPSRPEYLLTEPSVGYWFATGN